MFSLFYIVYMYLLLHVDTKVIFNLMCYLSVSDGKTVYFIHIEFMNILILFAHLITGFTACKRNYYLIILEYQPVVSQ